jgi:nucleotide-binding universal stress UspA family protein
MFKKILCPVDFGEFTKFQLDFARTMAGEQKSDVTALYVLSYPVNIYELQSGAVLYQQAEQIARERMKQYCGDDIHPLISDALNEAARIVEIAREQKFDLILMPTHGYRGIRKMFFGSVFQGVLLSSNIPVLALPPGFLAQGNGKFRKPANILCAIDLQQGSEKLIKLAETLGSEFQASFSVVHSIDLKTELMPLLEPGEGEKAVKTRILREFPEAERARKIIVHRGSAYENIAVSAIEDRVDLVMLGFSHRSQMRLRSTLYRTITELTMPVLCIPVD